MSNKPSHEFACRLVWTGAAAGPVRDYASYSREYTLDVAGKPTLRGSAATAFRGDASLHNPEDLLVASLSACHFLTYAALCARHHVELIAYEDAATGTLSYDDAQRVMRFTEVVLHPTVTIAKGADPAQALALHEKAHHDCFIANSVNFPVRHAASITVAS